MSLMNGGSFEKFATYSERGVAEGREKFAEHQARGVAEGLAAAFPQASKAVQ